MLAAGGRLRAEGVCYCRGVMNGARGAEMSRQAATTQANNLPVQLGTRLLQEVRSSGTSVHARPGAPAAPPHPPSSPLQPAHLDDIVVLLLPQRDAAQPSVGQVAPPVVPCRAVQ